MVETEQKDLFKNKDYRSHVFGLKNPGKSISLNLF